MNEAEKEWWAEWWAADYSWEGLAQKDAEGWPSLQAYWAAKTIGGDPLEDYLIEETDAEGRVIRRWTPFHLPYHFEDGTPTEKSTNPEEFAEAMERALAPLLNEWVEGKGHAHFSGIVTPVFPALPREKTAKTTYTLRLNKAHFSGEALSFSFSVFPGSVDFRLAQFSGGYVSFEEAQFSGGDVSFERAQFSGGAAYFYGAQFSGGRAEFHSAEFSGGRADFSGAQFSGEGAYFNNTRFSGGLADFSRAHFSGGPAYFAHASFTGGPAHFENARFSGGHVDFWFARFSGGGASFSGAHFSGGGVDFRFAAFANGAAHFRGTHFSGGRADFWNAKFNGSGAFFIDAQFSGGMAHFKQAEFSEGVAHFGDVTFHQNASFEAARFKKQVTFAGSEFYKRSLFTNLEWPANPLDAEGAFADVVFNRQADFTGKNFTAFSAFRGAIFNREIVLSRDDIFEKSHVREALQLTEDNIEVSLRDRAQYQAEHAFRRQIETAERERDEKAADDKGKTRLSLRYTDYINRDFYESDLQQDHHARFSDKVYEPYQGDTPILDLTPDEAELIIGEAADKNYERLVNAGERKRMRENHYREFELGARALRVGLENARDNLGQMRMLRVELLAQRKHPAMDFGEKWLSYAYDGLSDFGISFFRPAVALLASWLLMGLVYTGWYTVENQTRFQDVALEGLNFSAQAVFKPLSYWGYDEIEDNSFGQSLIYGTGAFSCAAEDAACRENVATQTKSTNWRSFGVRLLATVQSFFSIAMLFLAALAARRLFQMRS